MDSHYQINIKNYSKVRELGKGGFGSVYEVKDAKNRRYAAKVIGDSRNVPQELILREINIMLRNHHPTLVNIIGFSPYDLSGHQNFTIIMDLFQNGSLSDIIIRNPSNYDNTSRQIILIGSAYGMMYLHHQKVIHRDLKTDNILIDENFFPHISDFGLAKFWETGYTSFQTGSCGTIYFMAPEMFSTTNYNFKVDVYAFAYVMYAVITDVLPFSLGELRNVPPLICGNYIANKNVRPIFNRPVKQTLRSLIERCWSRDPNDRPSFDTIFKAFISSDYFLDGVNLNRISQYVRYITNGSINLQYNQSDSRSSAHPQQSSTSMNSAPRNSNQTQQSQNRQYSNQTQQSQNMECSGHRSLSFYADYDDLNDESPCYSSIYSSSESERE